MTCVLGREKLRVAIETRLGCDWSRNSQMRGSSGKVNKSAKVSELDLRIEGFWSSGVSSVSRVAFTLDGIVRLRIVVKD